MLLALLCCLAASPEMPALAVEPERMVAFDAPDGAKGVRAEFVVPHGAAAVAELIWQGQYVRAIFPEVKQRTLAKVESDSSMLVDYLTDGGIADFKYQVRFQRERRPDGSILIRWDKVHGDMGIVRGTWTLTPLAPDYCRAVYESFATLGPSFLDGFVRDGIARSTQGIAERVRKSAATDAAQRLAPPMSTP